MKNIEKELYDVYLKYRDFDFMNYYYEISKSNTNVKYSKGIGHYAGLYEPSYVMEMLTTNHTIGKEVTKIENGFNYKYYFDENGRIILSEKYLDDKYLFGEICYLNFYFYENNCLEYIFYNVTRGIYSLSKSFYDEKGRIIRHIALPHFTHNFYYNTNYVEEEYSYDNDITYVKLKEYFHPCDRCDFIKERTRITNMKIVENMLYSLDENNNIKGYWPIRFKLVEGKKVSVPLPKKVPVFKIVKENIIRILDKWKDIDKSVIWVNCESLDLEMQYTTLKEDSEEKWNIAFYDANEEEIFEDKNHVQALEDLLFNNGCNIDDLINESEYFVNKLIKIIKELRKEGYIADDTAVILSDLEISDNTLAIAKKINNKGTIKGFFEEFN